MKRRLLTFATVGITVAGAAAVYALVDASHDSTATRAGANTFHCSTFQIPAPVGATVESLTATEVSAGTFQVPGSPPLGGYPVPGVPAHCEVTVTLTHPGANDHAKVQVWLPESGWNGRFQAVGGAAYAAGNIGGVATAVKQGYAAATTDAGVDTSGLDTSWGLDPSGKVNAALLENFSSRSVHELAIVGKQVVKDVYGNAASYAYWNGCSTGGPTADATTVRGLISHINGPVVLVGHSYGGSVISAAAAEYPVQFGPPGVRGGELLDAA